MTGQFGWARVHRQFAASSVSVLLRTFAGMSGRSCTDVAVDTVRRDSLLVPARQPLRRGAHRRRELVELPGADSMPFSGDADALLDEIEEFRHGAAVRAARIACWRHWCSPTSSARRSVRPRWATPRGVKRELDAHDVAVRREVARFGGREAGHDGRRLRRAVRESDECGGVRAEHRTQHGAARAGRCAHGRVRATGRRRRGRRRSHRGSGRRTSAAPATSSCPARWPTSSRDPDCGSGRWVSTR